MLVAALTTVDATVLVYINFKDRKISFGLQYRKVAALLDAVIPQATAAGAKVKRPLQDQFYGDRSATLEDPFGHVWTVATHIEDVDPAEAQRRMEEMMNSGSGTQ